MAGNFLGFNLPFGSSNVNNTNLQPGGANNPNFPSKNQMDPKNPGADVKNQQQQQNGNNEPNEGGENNADPNKGAQGSQLDSFKDLFKLPTDDKGNVVSSSNPLAEPLFAIDPAKVKEAASKMNFASGVDPATAQKALQGDVQSFMDVINSVAQAGFAAAFQANAGITETAFNKNNARFESALPDRIRATQIKQTAIKHPALNHPAATVMIDSLKSTIAQTNPTLSPERVADMAENYVIAMAGDINNVNSQQQQQNQRNSTMEVDWAELLSPSNGNNGKR